MDDFTISCLYYVAVFIYVIIYFILNATNVPRKEGILYRNKFPALFSCLDPNDLKVQAGNPDVIVSDQMTSVTPHIVLMAFPHVTTKQFLPFRDGTLPAGC